MRSMNGCEQKRRGHCHPISERRWEPGWAWPQEQWRGGVIEDNLGGRIDGEVKEGRELHVQGKVSGFYSWVDISHLRRG